MATDRNLEMILGTLYPASMRHIQQLIMDSEACANAYGKKSLFGKDKFEPAMDKFILTIDKCVISLQMDGHINDTGCTEAGIDALNCAMKKCEKVYSSWPMGFQFWNDWYAQFKAKNAALEEVFVKFDEGKNEFLKILVEGLSDPDSRERQDCADLIRNEVVPALELDSDPASKAASLETLKKLMTQLRPPQSQAEMSDLNNAAIYYMQLQLRLRS